MSGLHWDDVTPARAAALEPLVRELSPGDEVTAFHFRGKLEAQDEDVMASLFSD